MGRGEGSSVFLFTLVVDTGSSSSAAPVDELSAAKALLVTILVVVSRSLNSGARNERSEPPDGTRALSDIDRRAGGRESKMKSDC